MQFKMYCKACFIRKVLLIPNQSWLIMKLTIILLTATLLQAHANSYSQAVTFSGRDVPLQKIFAAIEKQTGFVFFYKNSLLRDAKPVTIEAKQTPLLKVLQDCMAGQPLDFSIENTTIVISKKPPAYQPRDGEAPRLKVSGIIKDNETGLPLAGATIMVQETRTRTQTNDKGYFEIMALPGHTLVISYVGFNDKTVKLDDTGNGGNLDVALERRKNDMQEVNVTISTGYQNISKERVTGSYGSVNKEQLNKPAINISQRIVGAVAGVQARSLDVDGNPTFEIRGQTSLYGNARPLIVVDGFPVQGDFNSINPSDVESITVLKDAAAASIWGARAANGVIVIVTRSAKKGIPLKVEFSAFSRIGKKFDLDYVNPLASSEETVTYEKMAFNNWSAVTNPGSLLYNSLAWSPATIAMSEQYLGFITMAQRDATLEQLKAQSNKSQIADNLLANPVNNQYNLTLFGSSGKMSNALSLLFEKNKSNFKETGSNRYMLNYRSTANVFKWLDLNLSAMVQYNKFTNNGVSLSDIQGISPYEMLVNPDGSLTNIHQYYWPIMQRLVPMQAFPYADWTYNPIQEIHNRDITTTQLNTRLQAGLTFKLLKGLTIDSKIQYELFNNWNRNLYNENTFFVRRTVNEASTWDQATNKITPNLPKGSILTQSRGRSEAFNFRNQLNYNRVFFGKHEINLAAGAEVNNNVVETFGQPTTYGYNNESLTLGTFPNGPGGTFYPIKNWMGSNQTFGYTNSFTYATERYFSSFANLAYTFNRRYTISGSYRTDASNLITDDPKYRYAPFWSAGALWNVTRENFMAATSWIDRLALRATYGYNGNVDKTTAFMPLISTTAIPNTYTNDFTASISSYGNPSLRWEKTGTWNLGIDYSFFDSRLFGKIDVYNKSGKDLIAQLSIPAVNGTTSQKLNNAEMTNRGIELELGSALKIRGNDIVWRGNLNFSYNKNKITKLFIASYPASNLTAGGSYAYVEGKNANDQWRFTYAGMYNTQPMVKGPDTTLYDFGAYTPGDGRTYMRDMGTTVAPYTFGFINSFKVYNFDLSFIITGKFGHVFQRKGFNYPPTWGSRVLPNKKIGEVVNGDPMKIVPLPQNLVEPRYYFWDRFHQNLDYLMVSASHMRLQEVNLTYNLPGTLLKKIAFNGLQVFVQGNDLLTVYANDAKEDPEFLLGTMKPRPKLTFGIRGEF